VGKILTPTFVQILKYGK
jgi:hypothetical protein